LSRAALILGNQLFPSSHLRKLEVEHVFMAEDYGLCTHERYHKHKLILFLTAMREYAELLKDERFDVSYEMLNQSNKDVSYEEKLSSFIKQFEVKELVTFEIEDKFFEQRIVRFCKKEELKLTRVASPMFLCSRERFCSYLEGVKTPSMKIFYEKERVRLDILMDGEGSPKGGKWSFDEDNRKKLPKSVSPPDIPKRSNRDSLTAVKRLVEELFSAHPGSVDNFWLPVTRREALSWFRAFLKQRFRKFGEYEDALTSRSDVVFHSALSPLLNLGLLLPKEVIERAVEGYEDGACEINSVEGLVRQIMGWREFIRGIYQNYSEEEEEANFFEHSAELSDVWYRGNSGIPMLDDSLDKVFRLGYAHHIERLMLFGNLMLLSGVAPKAVHRWFMEMFVDSSDWVMGPNVYGMSQFSDGGIFATKPYICGSNYLLKMSDYANGDWSEGIDGLYWGFIRRYKKFFSKNPRMSMMVSMEKKMDTDKQKRLENAAKKLRKKLIA